MVGDPRGTDRLKPLHPHVTCQQKHLGLCSSRDSTFLNTTLHCCYNLNTLVSGCGRWDLIGCALRIVCTSSEDAVEHVKESVLVFAVVRFARPVLQIFAKTHGFENDGLVRLKTSDESGIDFCTNYSAMKSLLTSATTNPETITQVQAELLQTVVQPYSTGRPLSHLQQQES